MHLQYKITKAVILFIIFSATNLIGQESEILDKAMYQFKYLLTYQKDSTDVQSVTSEEMMLTVGSKVSMFQSIGGYRRDSVLENILSGDLNSINLQTANIPKTGFREIVYKDYTNKKLTYREQVLKDYFEYQDTLSLFNWVINEKIKKINGYDCQMATMMYAGRAYEAWFTTEIPISDGPYKFNGLPGLIIKLYDTNNHYIFNLITVQKIVNKNITLSKKNYILTTQKELLKVKKEFEENIFSKLEETGISINFEGPSQKRDLLKKIKKRNNPIELPNE